MSIMLLPKHKLVAVNSCIFLIAFFCSHLLPQVPQQLHERYVNILKLMSEDEYDQSIIEFQQLISEHPDFHKAYKKIAEVYFFTNNLEAGQNYFENLLTENPKNPYALYALAKIDFKRQDYEHAIEKFKKSIELDAKFADAYKYPGGLPEVYRTKEDLNSAIQYFGELIQADPKNACAYYGLANIHIRKYEWDEALRILTKSIELDPELTLAYQSMIYSLFRTARYDKVLATSEELLKVADRIDDIEAISYATMMIGNAYLVQGDYFKALYHLNEALKHAQEIGSKSREATCLQNIAAVYAMSANFPKALKYFIEALQLAKKTGNKFSEVQMLNNIGNVYKDQGGKPQQALKYYREALESAKKNKLKYEESLVLSNMAEVYQKRSDYDKAIAYQNNALRIAKEIGDKYLEGYILRNLGTLNQDLGNDSAAVNYLYEALEIGIETKDVQIIWETQAGLGSCYEKQGDLQRAITHYANAIAIYDSVRNSLDIESLRNNYLEDKYEAYPSIVQLLAHSGKYKDAFIYAEKYKAKTMLGILSQGRNLFSELLSDTLKAQLQQITSQHESAHTELSKELSKTARNKDKIFSLDQKITDLELKKVAIMEDFKNKHRTYYQLTSPEILGLDDLQHRILDDGQAVVEYILGPEKMSVFVITIDTLVYSQVAVDREGLQTMLADLSPIFGFQNSGEQAREQTFTPQPADFSIFSAHALYEVLIKPVEKWLQDTKELIIVPDDILFYLPFEMLVFDTTGVESPYDYENAKFLLEKFDVSYVSSASLLEPGLQTLRKPNKGILAMGNPDFGPQPVEPEQGELLASKESITGGRVKRESLFSLPDSETEVKAIGRVLRGLSNNIFTGNRATEENFKLKATDYRILHLATHFVPNDNQPLYSKIVLTQNDKSEEDGYLQTYEVFNMNLNADLVVLSACNTALGKPRKGEGLIGISRAFLFAGVPSLVVSLWNVDDKATAIIMRDFYKYMKSGFNKKHALRRAKVDYLRASKGSPYYWAPFILIGDWQPLDLTTRPALTLNTWLIGIVTLLVIATTLIIKRKSLFR